MNFTKPLHELISESNDELREAKEKLFDALNNRHDIDYLTENELELLSVLEESPTIKYHTARKTNKNA